MDCPICYEQIKYSCTGGLCLHHFCYPCLFNWCAISAEKNVLIAPCPVCRSPIFEIRFDPETDILSNSEKDASFKYPNEILIEYCLGRTPGVILQNNRGPGVKVSLLTRNSLFYKAGVRKGDIIILINNIPCYDKQQVYYIINNTYKNKLPIKINTLISRLSL